VGGRLRGHDAWVHRDLTGPGWRRRAVGRTLVQVLPVVAATGLLPAPAVLHVLLALFIVLGSTFVTAAYGDELRDRRLRQHAMVPPERDFGPGSYR
jgi:hypothetical protein